MRKSIRLLRHGFESSCSTTEEFLNFVRTFRSEFTEELKSIGATDIQIGKGHFYVSGFFTVDGQIWYFSLSDVRGMEYYLNKLMYRTAKDYKDFVGGQNRYVTIETGMAKNMCWSFKVVE